MDALINSVRKYRIGGGRAYDPQVLKACKTCADFLKYAAGWIHCRSLGAIRMGTARYCKRKKAIK